MTSSTIIGNKLSPTNGPITHITVDLGGNHVLGLRKGYTHTRIMLLRHRMEIFLSAGARAGRHIFAACALAAGLHRSCGSAGAVAAAAAAVASSFSLLFFSYIARDVVDNDGDEDGDNRHEGVEDRSLNSSKMIDTALVRCNSAIESYICIGTRERVFASA
uniref:Uncharacterized protein n=1 Tax=Trichogramma kaykai TaxID=54128 RepID=A0ABD2XDG1_9HYME